MDRLSKCNANYVPLTPLMFLKRASNSYADRTSIIYENIRFTWRQTSERCCRLASSTVSVLAPNIPAMYEMHFAVPMAGAVLNTINTRLDAKNIATPFFVTLRPRLFSSTISTLSQWCSAWGVGVRELIHTGNPGFVPVEIHDEWDPIALNYTSGTTSEPKGVVYSHRGAYLSTLSLILGWEMGNEPVYLWSLPMFHCNGWTLHGALQPEAKPDERRPSPHGGAPPPASLLEKMEHLGFHITHAYGMTEATGPALVCEWQAKWNHLSNERKAKLKARQGISVLTLEDVDVKDMETMASVPHDGKTIGEIVLRGSSIMKGYLKDEEATSKAFKDGWFFTGDVGVIHPDGYLEIKDRSKDVIISGGENISSVELESVLYKHPRVLEAAVVAMPHPRWGRALALSYRCERTRVEKRRM
ncbi:Benzoate--CoA ligase, peroxisomal [Hibiscus syriacus]|uniref:Benzoate--CoA ligase, peroxisomal n=1 Tax=Hibiscus syriacus TaxID=106335 RepID=A0A6A2XQZ4_HIBSY|nr:Benzoate--CoA ligase, peroxisomal [Hibiscus syriacus]